MAFGYILIRSLYNPYAIYLRGTINLQGPTSSLLSDCLACSRTSSLMPTSGLEGFMFRVLGAAELAFKLVGMCKLIMP